MTKYSYNRCHKICEASQCTSYNLLHSYFYKNVHASKFDRYDTWANKLLIVTKYPKYQGCAVGWDENDHYIMLDKHSLPPQSRLIMTQSLKRSQERRKSNKSFSKNYVTYFNSAPLLCKYLFVERKQEREREKYQLQ